MHHSTRNRLAREAYVLKPLAAMQVLGPTRVPSKSLDLGRRLLHYLPQHRLPSNAPP